MGEGEVVLRIGRPDHEALVAHLKGQPEEKTLDLFPGRGRSPDPHGPDPEGGRGGRDRAQDRALTGEPARRWSCVTSSTAAAVQGASTGSGTIGACLRVADPAPAETKLCAMTVNAGVRGRIVTVCPTFLLEPFDECLSPARRPRHHGSPAAPPSRSPRPPTAARPCARSCRT
ncbi:MAG: hypothetical protein MZW92_23825 [Comamonadaceae bacterium]|nr:hypothetical protein [Comamonadaceae bacterium]